MAPVYWVAIALAGVAALAVIGEALFGHRTPANLAGLALLISIAAAVLAGTAATQ